MTKRFTYDSKTVSILKDREFWLDGNVDTACNHKEICNELNKFAEENEELKSDKNDLITALQLAIDKNEQLKQQIKQLQHWNNCLAEKRHKELNE